MYSSPASCQHRIDPRSSLCVTDHTKQQVNLVTDTGQLIQQHLVDFILVYSMTLSHLHVLRSFKWKDDAE
jgi:hypothetical protein